MLSLSRTWFSPDDPLRIHFQDGPEIIPRVGRFAQDIAPIVGRAVSPGGQHPVLENLALRRVAVRIDLDIAPARSEPLHLPKRLDAAGALQIVYRVDRDYRLKAVVRKRQLHCV